jgi:hypothetical protein
MEFFETILVAVAVVATVVRVAMIRPRSHIGAAKK